MTFRDVYSAATSIVEVQSSKISNCRPISLVARWSRMKRSWIGEFASSLIIVFVFSANPLAADRLSDDMRHNHVVESNR